MHFTTPPITHDFTITAAAKSVQGSKCEVNEDCYRMDEHRGIFVIADGIGGQCGGERASRLATAGLMREAQSLLARRKESGVSVPALMAQAFLSVNESILGVAEHLPRFRGMGASAVMAILDSDRLYIAGVGDCRAYLLRGDQAERMTVDQTVFQLLVDAGIVDDEHQKSRSRRLLWTCVGDPTLELPSVRCQQLQRGDRLILVTNGVTRVLKDDLIGRLGSTAENAVATATNVVNAALTFRTADDATCVAVSVDGASSESL